MVRLPVPLQGEGLGTVRAAVGVLPVVDLLVEHQAHQGRVDLPAVPALVGVLPSVGSLVGLQVGLFVEASVTLAAVDHLPAAVCGAAAPRCLRELRVILCREETASEPSSGWKTGTLLHRQNTGFWPIRLFTRTISAAGFFYPSQTLSLQIYEIQFNISPRDRKSRPSSHILQSISLTDSFLKTGDCGISTSPSGSLLM